MAAPVSHSAPTSLSSPLLQAPPPEDPEPSAFFLESQAPDLRNRPIFMEPLQMHPIQQGRIQPIPFDIPWEEGAPLDKILQDTDQSNLLQQVHVLFQAAQNKQLLWNLNSSNLYRTGNGMLAFIRAELWLPFNEIVFKKMAETYHCSQGDEVYTFILYE